MVAKPIGLDRFANALYRCIVLQYDSRIPKFLCERGMRWEDIQHCRGMTPFRNRGEISTAVDGAALRVDGVLAVVPETSQVFAESPRIVGAHSLIPWAHGCSLKLKSVRTQRRSALCSRGLADANGVAPASGTGKGIAAGPPGALTRHATRFLVSPEEPLADPQATIASPDRGGGCRPRDGA